MELIEKTMEPNAYNKYDHAKRRVKEIKNFYNHILIFVMINVSLYVVRFYVFPKIGFVSDEEGFNNWLNWNTFLMPLFWAVGITIHGIWAFRHKFIPVKKWEERKIQEFMDKEEQETQRWK